MISKKTFGLLASTALMSASGQAPAAGADLPMALRPMRAAPAASPSATQIIVKYRDGGADAASRLATLSAAALRAGLTQTTAGSTGRSAPLTSHLVRRQASGASLLRLARRLPAAQMEALLAQLRADPAVEYAVADRMLRPIKEAVGPVRPLSAALAAAGQAAAAAPDDPRYASYQWPLHGEKGGIRAPAAWETSTGKGVVVAVLDTGILPDHPDLKNGAHILQGYDFISTAAVSRRGQDGRAPGALDYGDWTEEDNDCGLPAENSSWHGTHTAGTVAELTNNGLGGAGVAYDAQILPVRVLGRCGGGTSDIADAIRWASGGSIEGIPANANPAEVISLSLGGPGACDSEMQGAIDAAVGNGSVVVVAAGNDASNAAQFSPASCRNVITVGATRITGGIASYSNYGSVVDLSGPGGGGSEDPGNGGWDGVVLSTGSTAPTTPQSGEYAYVGLNGTSMATPHVAAVAALVQSALAAAGAAPLTPSRMETVLKRTARPFPVAPPLTRPIGSGIVDAAAAMDYVRQGCYTQECNASVVALSNRTPATGLTASEKGELNFSFQATAGKPLNVTSYGGGGGVHLYVQYATAPTTATTTRSVRAGTAQTVRVPAPATGTYYIKLIAGDAGFTNVALMAWQ